uniref:Uncharacterized protein n=1 Tax=Chromera velia CCMP2878 TaxID=1169474 RepID=A0A0G4HHU9_9ALVE|eukprot:Cvel_27723.t1-p1 / transcript=Cvel_27723.t1 / gene=Cvel_27723 / organism=Chromera_velia_CCMP2878 / gene_product=hypothetical protein / transcript_product=hypothetical protein / location=Cvel_scaffold3506:4846-7593(+) / protein_length=323 / sequence_SO=supercontig / SO=protein_coding / is_pseudo=false
MANQEVGLKVISAVFGFISLCFILVALTQNTWAVKTIEIVDTATRKVTTWNYDQGLREVETEDGSLAAFALFIVGAVFLLVGLVMTPVLLKDFRRRFKISVMTFILAGGVLFLAAFLSFDLTRNAMWGDLPSSDYPVLSTAANLALVSTVFAVCAAFFAILPPRTNKNAFVDKDDIKRRTTKWDKESVASKKRKRTQTGLTSEGGGTREELHLVIPGDMTEASERGGHGKAPESLVKSPTESWKAGISTERGAYKPSASLSRLNSSPPQGNPSEVPSGRSPETLNPSTSRLEDVPEEPHPGEGGEGGEAEEVQTEADLPGSAV